MGTGLIVGRLPDKSMVPFVTNFAKSALRNSASELPQSSILSKIFDKNPLDKKAESFVEEWNSGPAENSYIDTLNEASLCMFLDYTARLEGHVSSEVAIEKSRWKNLPYWLQSVWLPLDGLVADPVVKEIEGMPTLIGSAGNLLLELEDIANKADIDLKEKPDGFELMISDSKAFYNLNNFALDESATLQWLWNSYCLGTKLALLHNRPLWSGG